MKFETRQRKFENSQKLCNNFLETKAYKGMTEKQIKQTIQGFYNIPEKHQLYLISKIENNNT